MNSSIASTDGYTRIVRFDPTSLLFAPSTVHMFAVTPPPLTDRSEPPSSPLSLTLRKSGALTPGISVASCRKLRPLSGSSRTCWPVITPDTSPPTVFTGVDSALTLTVSDNAPADSSKSILRSSATLRTMSVRVAVLNPCSSTDTV